MIWYILISLFLLLLTWILLGPVILFLNTDNNRYYLSLPGVFKAAVVPSEEIFHIRGWIFFVPFAFHPMRERKKKHTKQKDQSARKKSWKMPSGGIRMLRGVLRAFRIRRLDLDIDTDDFILNAWLVPAFSAMNSGNIHMQVNFQGNASLLLDVRTRLGTLLWIFTKQKVKSIF